MSNEDIFSGAIIIGFILILGLFCKCFRKICSSPVDYPQSELDEVTVDSRRNSSFSYEPLPDREPYPELNLHGYSVSKACAKAFDFVHKCQRDRHRGVVLITGKGIHSPFGPQIKPAIINMAEKYGWNYSIDPTNEGRITVNFKVI